MKTNKRTNGGWIKIAAPLQGPSKKERLGMKKKTSLPAKPPNSDAFCSHDIFILRPATVHISAVD